MIAAGSALDLLTGCSPVLEATRPNPVDLTQFRPGQSHDSVIETVGTPKGTLKEADGSSCDSYELYTHGPSGAGKAGLAFLEGAADFFTLGLAEAVLTPAEAGTRNSLHPVTFCYKEDKLAKLTENGNTITSSESWGPVVAKNDAASDPTPSATVTPSPVPTSTATPGNSSAAEL
ncbi:MAG TPA: hypothetical protein VMT61_04370 [Candidatus Binataceae bacterium]|nr:hypothetical protein [Candidatus Binataceae bacterium]